jgi:hypothetical protein
VHLVAPFADFQADTWLEKMKAGGFTPADAMKVYDDIRMFGHFSLRNDPVSEGDRMWDEVRERVCERLKNIKTPEDFQKYLRDTGKIMLGDGVKEKDMSAFTNKWMNTGNYDRLDRDDMITRVSGSLPYKQPEQWKAWDDVGMEWDDLPVAMGHDILQQPQIDTSLDEAQALARLEKSVRDSGLRGVEWGVATGSNSQLLVSTAHNIEQANELLEKRTGWSGQLLGLSGRINLRLGLDLTGNSGTCAPLGWVNDLYNLNTNASVGWAVVSHEWLHGLDFAMGHEAKQREPMMASEMPNADNTHRAPWKKLIAEMTGHRFGPGDASVIKTELNEGFHRRWTGQDVTVGLVDVLEVLLAEHPGEILTDAQRNEQHAKITDFLRANNPEKGNFEMRAEIAMTEMDLLREQDRIMNEGGSIWIQFANRFKENVQKYHPKLQQDWAGYFLMPSEQAAHSFESTFSGNDCFITDVNPEQSSLRYPLPAEAMAQNLSWKRLFKATAGWWETQKAERSAQETPEDAQPIAIAARLEDRIQQRRKAAQQPEAAHHSPKPN